MRLLLAEDDPVLGDGLIMSFSQYGFAVDWVTEGSSTDAALKGLRVCTSLRFCH